MAALPVKHAEPAKEPSADDWREWVTYHLGSPTRQWTIARNMYKMLSSFPCYTKSEKKDDTMVVTVCWPTVADYDDLFYRIGLGAAVQMRQASRPDREGLSNSSMRFRYEDVTFWEMKSGVLSDDSYCQDGEKAHAREVKQASGKTEASVVTTIKSAASWASGRDVAWKWVDVTFYDCLGKDVGNLRVPL